MRRGSTLIEEQNMSGWGNEKSACALGMAVLALKDMREKLNN